MKLAAELPNALATSRNLQSCGGDLLAVQYSIDPDQDTAQTVDVLTVTKWTHEVAPLRYRGMPSYAGNSLQFMNIEKREFLLWKNATLALAAEITCTQLTE